MKKLIFAMGASVLLVSTSCRKDDDNPASEPLSMLVGTWKISKSVIYSGTNNAVLAEMAAPACEGNSTFRFAQDKSFEFKTYSEANGTCALESTDTGKYVYNESSKTLTFTYSDNTTESTTVHALTSSQLQIIGDQDDYNSDGTLDKLVIVLNK